MSIQKEKELMVSNLVLRAISAVVLAPLVVLTLYFGGIYFQALVLICLFLMLNEWFSINKRDKKPLLIGTMLVLGIFTILKLALTIPIYDMRYVIYALSLVLIYGILLLNNRNKIVKIFNGILLALVCYTVTYIITVLKPYGYPARDLIIFMGIIVLPLSATFLLNKGTRETKFFITGMIYIIIPMIYAICKSSEGTENFFKISLWILVVVWSCDIFAYLGGRLIGGTKLAPSISPKKTWSGAIIGSVMTLAIAYFFITRFVSINRLSVLAITLVMIIASIFGDLLESKAKRMLNVKDSGNIIPGHGGILDRLDSLLMVLYVFVITEMILYFKLDLKILLTLGKWG